jgi:hypothetical protein
MLEYFFLSLPKLGFEMWFLQNSEYGMAFLGNENFADFRVSKDTNVTFVGNPAFLWEDIRVLLYLSRYDICTSIPLLQFPLENQKVESIFFMFS